MALAPISDKKLKLINQELKKIKKYIVSLARGYTKNKDYFNHEYQDHEKGEGEPWRPYGGLSDRMGKNDVQDLIQIGMLQAYDYLSKNSNMRKGELLYNWELMSMDIRNAMNRGGLQDYRIFGDLPFQISNSKYKEEIFGDGEDGPQNPISTTNIDDIDIEQPENLDRKYDIASRAIDKTDFGKGNRKYDVRQMFKDLLSGQSQVDVAKKYGVSKVAINNAIKRHIDKIRDNLEESKRNKQFKRKLEEALNKI